MYRINRLSNISIHDCRMQTLMHSINSLMNRINRFRKEINNKDINVFHD